MSVTSRNKSSKVAKDAEAGPEEDGLTLSLDAFVRSVGVRRARPHALFLGAGASTTSGIPSAESCIWEWKRHLFLTNNPGLEDQFAELSLPSVRHRIQQWLDRQGTYPAEGAAEEYGYYIDDCFPIPDDRRAYFQQKVRTAKPHIGYRLLSHLAQADIFRSVWSTNFDGLAARAAANFSLTPLEVGIDTQGRLDRQSQKGELLCVSLHGDYRYDKLMNTPDELQRQEEALRNALIDEMAERPLIVCGYSGRDQSIMDALNAACSEKGSGTLYWCGHGDGDIHDSVAALIAHARAHGRSAYYVPSLGFDDLMTRLALHCLQGEAREDARRDVSELAPPDLLSRQPFQVAEYQRNTIIKSNAFEIDCPGEVLSFDLKQWPKEKVWSWIREQTQSQPVVAVPLKGKVLALGTVDHVKDVFGDNIKGKVERTPVSPNELRFEDGAIVSLMREALVRSMARVAEVPTNGYSELWFPQEHKKMRQGDVLCHAYESVVVFLRQIGGAQYVILKPSIKVLDAQGKDVPHEIAGAVKLGILGWQHNKEFNQAVNKWRKLLFGDTVSVFAFPEDEGSSFKFRIRRSPAFAQIGIPGTAKRPRSLKSCNRFSSTRGSSFPNRHWFFPTSRGLPLSRIHIPCAASRRTGLTTFR